MATVLVLCGSAAAWAGPTEHVGRELSKGVGQELKQAAQDNKIDLHKGAKDIGSGLAEGVAGHGKELGRGANDLGRELVRGVLTELRSQALCQGPDREECLDALVERFAYAGSRAAARGAADGAPPWPSIAIGAAGFAGGLLTAALVALLLGQRRMRRQVGALRPQTA
jgi:hypothetical protein